uniref:NACHT domain-containing protein n=1 Tax=Cyprinus carpio carpio TaxID=630221 RepID=A0A9J8D966_CYPCA
MKANKILNNQRKCFCKYLDDKIQGNLSFIPLVLKTDSVMKTHCKIKLKYKKCKKLRPKKLRAYIPNEGQALSPEDLLRWQDKNILIIGKPGVGKTTVVQEMLRLWGEKDGREIDYMFYFDQSVLAHSSVASLEALLFDVYSKPMEKDRKEVFQDIEENSENVVIVFDGVTDLEENSILWKIMDHDLLPDAKIVITCRSEEEDDPLFSDWPTQTVYVQGFSADSIRNYYQKMLGHDPVLLEVVLKNQELFSLSHVPMYAFMVAAFIPFKNDTENNHQHTVTEMYIHIFRLTVMTHGGKKIKEIDKYLGEINDQIHPLMKTAFSATMHKTLNFNICDETNICHAFLKNITLQDSVSSATTYCAFLHNTMQEFFSALWLLGHPDEIEEVLQLCQTEEHKHMRHVLPFLCGLLSEHNTRLLKCLFPEDQIKKTSDWFIEKLLDTLFQPQSESEEFDLLYVCQCLYELQSPKACLIFLEKMNHRLEPEVDLDPHQCCALSYVIGQSRDKEVYLNLEDCTVADVGMDMMLSCSPNIRLKTCKKPLKQITFFVEFFHKSSHCNCKLFEMRGRYDPEKCNALLDLSSHVKNYETQTGRSYLPALQSVFQSPDVWIIDLLQRKSSVLLEVLKLQTQKKPVYLRRCSEEESEVMSFLQCLPYISKLRFSDQSERVLSRFLLSLFIKAAEIETQTGKQMLKLLSSVCTSSSGYRWTCMFFDWDFLLDLCSHVKNYETQTGRNYLPALQSVFQSPDEWIIDLSQRKSSVLLEVLKLQTEKKPVNLRRCSEEESEVMSFLQCLPYISQLRFWDISAKETRMSAVRFLLDLCVGAVETDRDVGTRFSTLLSSVCSYKTFPFDEDNEDYDAGVQSDFLLDLCSHVKNYEPQTGRNYLPALQSVFLSPDEWFIDLSQRKISVLLEVLKLQTEKKSVKLRCSEEESEVMSFLQCLQHISQLRFWDISAKETRMSAVRFLLNLCVAAVETDRDVGTRFWTLLSSVCSYKTFPFEEVAVVQSDFLLDLYSHVKNYETHTGRNYLPALQSVFQSPDEWIIDLSQRKISVLLEVLKLQTEKKSVKLRRCSEEESEVMSFLQCLPYISQLRFWVIYNKESRMSAVRLLLNLCVAAVETDRYTGTRFSTLLSSVCSYKTFPFDEDVDQQSDFLLDLYSHVKNYETQTGRSYLFLFISFFMGIVGDMVNCGTDWVYTQTQTVSII